LQNAAAIPERHAVDIQLDIDWMLALLLIGTRLAGALVFSPLLGFNVLPAPVRVTFVLVLSVVFALSRPTTALNITSLGQLGLAAVTEFLCGALIGLGVLAAFAAATFAGQLLDTQIGLNVAVLFDYNTQSQNPLLSTALGMLAGVVFLSLDGHHLLLRVIAQTFRIVPLAGGTLSVSPELLARQLGVVFLFGLALAAPIAVGVFLLDVATAFISRTMPQLNVYFVALPLKIFWGLFLLAITLSHAGPLFQRMFDDAVTAPLTS
jgi:flagellar biosynthetic protein FliR